MPRPLATLPKAHLHLHFTGAMRHPTLVELAGERRIHLPEALAAAWPPRLSGTDERGWFRFQRLYDIARSVLTDEPAVFRMLRETAQDERAEGSGCLEIQVDPSGYAGRCGGLTPTVELVLAAAHAAPAATGVGIGVIIAAAFRIAARAGLLLTPHGGELAGPASVWSCLDDLHADRIGHGVAAAADRELTKRLAASGIMLEVCPTSNVALGVATRPGDVPLRTLLDDGVPVALGADDPLLFGSRLNAQYEIARHVHGMSDAEIAELARMSVRASAAPTGTAARLLAGIDAWLAGPG